MKQNNTLTWSDDFNKQANFTKVYAHIIDETGKSLFKVFIDEYNGNADYDRSHDCFIAYIEKMQLLAHILNEVKALYDDLDIMDRYYVKDCENDAVASRDIRAFTTAIQDNVQKFIGFGISIYNIISDNLDNDEFKESL
jgi:hypothetical protein